MSIDGVIQRILNWFTSGVRVTYGPLPTARIYRRGDRLVVHAVRMTAKAFPYAGQPLLALPVAAEPATIGAALRTILAAAPHKSMDTPDWHLTNRLVPDAFGVKTWPELMKDSISVEIFRLGSDLQFIPTINEPDEYDDDEQARTFRFLKEQTLHTTTKGSDVEIGRVAIEAIAQSTIVL
jgi:hypothetical protein